MAAEWTLHTSIFLLTTIAVAASAHHLATSAQVVYQKLEHVLHDHASCGGHPPSSGTLTNHSYYHEFQWSSSPLLNLISVDQVLILDNILSESICHVRRS